MQPIQEPPIFDYEWMVEEDGFIERHEKEHDQVFGPDIEFETTVIMKRV